MEVNTELIEYEVYVSKTNGNYINKSVIMSMKNFLDRMVKLGLLRIRSFIIMILLSTVILLAIQTGITTNVVHAEDTDSDVYFWILVG